MTKANTNKKVGVAPPWEECQLREGNNILQRRYQWKAKTLGRLQAVGLEIPLHRYDTQRCDSIYPTQKKDRKEQRAMNKKLETSLFRRVEKNHKRELQIYSYTYNLEQKYTIQLFCQVLTNS